MQVSRSSSAGDCVPWLFRLSTHGSRRLFSQINNSSMIILGLLVQHLHRPFPGEDDWPDFSISAQALLSSPNGIQSQPGSLWKRALRHIGRNYI